ncbi:MAG: hypothetical protein V4505_20725 [Pseudomonadota bacterium]
MNTVAAAIQSITEVSQASWASQGMLDEQARAPEAPRVDLYSGIHKAVRALMADTLLALGRMDPDDGPELAYTGLRVTRLLDFCRDHLRHENALVHTAIESRAPGETAGLADDHADHEYDIDALAEATSRLLECPDHQRAAEALALYRQLSVFVARNFEHMQVEEITHNAVLWAHFSDAELRGIEAALVAAIPPKQMPFVLRWLVPFMNPAERAAMLGGMQASVPPAAFTAALDVVRPHLAAREWRKLAVALELPVA